MKFRDIVHEDGDGGGGGASTSTVSADVGGLAYPLFVKGKTRRQKRKNAKKAVGQKNYSGPSYIGKGVYESEGADLIEAEINELFGLGKKKAPAVKQSSVYRVLQQISTNTDPSPKDVKLDDGQIIQVTPAQATRIVNAATLQGSAGGWEKQLGDWEIFKKVVQFAKVPLGKLRKSNPRVHWTQESKVKEAHVVDHDGVIHKMNREDPMNKTEVAVLGGAGVYTLEGLRNKARNEAQALADELKEGGERGMTFLTAKQHIYQLQNTIETIVSAYNQLERIRRKGGRGSRGITREHIEPIQIGITVLTEAKDKFKI